MNSMTFSQAATVLTEVVKQATGQAVIAPINTPEDFVSVAQTALLNGRDPIINTISQMWSKTIFASRDYRAPLSSLEMDLPRYGNAVRKLSPVAAAAIDDIAFKYPVAYDATQTGNVLGNGLSVDPWKIAKQEVQQTNFYGTAVYMQRYTTFLKQFDASFNSAEEFAQFNAMNVTERGNDWASYKEAVARGMQANFIGGILEEAQTGRVKHLLTDYNALTGLSLTAQSVYEPDNFPAFIRWVYAEIATIVRMMGERSNKYQTVINGKSVLRFTRPENMRVALYAPAMEQINSMVLANTFNDNYMKLPTYEGVNFWQEIDTPDSISIKPVYTHTDGSVKKASSEVEQAGIFGVIHDKDALGYAVVDNMTVNSPVNQDGLYYNTALHATVKTLQDNTEKGVVLLLD